MVKIDLDFLESKFKEEFEKLKKEVDRPNILIVGATGVGKSTLVNLCFGKDIAEVGTGRPITQYMERYAIPDIPIVLFDTPGYEVDSTNHAIYLDDVINYAIENKMEQEKQIHFVWYCINTASHSISDFDINIITKFKDIGLPICVAFTKCDIVSEEDMYKMDQTLTNSVISIQRFQVTNKKTLNYLDLEMLCTWSIDKLPQGLKYAFIAAQRINLHVKRKESTNILLQHTSGSAFIGFIPFPFADAPVLLANQAGMFVRILFIYDMQSLIPSLKGILASMGIPTIISKSGVWLAAQLTKLIPGVGTIVGGIINGSVAASLTAAIGYSVIEFCERTWKIALDGNTNELRNFLDKSEKIFESIFDEQIKKHFKQTK
jgi:uncharacterized protein (DUF697 family)/GTP-binding protein EngB required for normal cell division